MEGSRTHRTLAKIKDKAGDVFWFCFAFCIILPLIWHEDRKDAQKKIEEAKQVLWEAAIEVEKKKNQKP